MKEHAITVQQLQDQTRINTAYVLMRSALAELAQVQQLDGELHRLLRDLYGMEDTLYQYVASTDNAKVV